MSQLHHNTTLSIYSDPPKFRHNRIICTIGPGTQSVEMLKKLILEGMSVARMNFSHGSYEFHKMTIDNVREAARQLARHVAIALDTKGPEIRTGRMEGGEARLEAGAYVFVTTNREFEAKGTKDKFYIDYENLTNVMKVGSHIFIDDGILNLEVVEKCGDSLRCLVHNTHLLTDRKGCNLPKTDVDLPAVSEKDKADLHFGAENEVDMVFASFIRSADQVRQVRDALVTSKVKEGIAHKIIVISKIENHQGVENIDDIIAMSDGIMVARGDLGVEIPAEKVLTAQKMLISKCNVVGKPVICATQMLESMTFNPRPTRAEVSDVANAVLDGADCVMLSGETAKGKFPVEVVSYMARICCEAQNAQRNTVIFNSIKHLQSIPMTPEEAVCSSAVNTAYEVQAKAIAVLSNSGRSAQLLSKYRPDCPIFCASQLTHICRQLCIVRGTIPVFYDVEALGDDPTRDKRVELCIQSAKEAGCVRAGDLMIAVHADLHTKGYANQSRVIQVS
jgi:pyruvate kinase